MVRSASAGQVNGKTKVRGGIIACLMITATLAGTAPAAAQATPAPLSWGVVGTFTPEWRVPPTFEILAAMNFSEDYATIEQLDLRGGEFRIGIARGSALAGDWGVSFVRRTYEDSDIEFLGEGGYSGGGSIGNLLYDVEQPITRIHRREMVLNGIEAHKFVVFGTIAKRVQIGMNFAGGYGTVKGDVDAEFLSLRSRCRYTTTDASPVTPSANPCQGGTLLSEETVQTGAISNDLSPIVKKEGMLIGRVEFAVGAIITPQIKIRFGGGLNFPGTSDISVTGIYFFGAK